MKILYVKYIDVTCDSFYDHGHYYFKSRMNKNIDNANLKGLVALERPYSVVLDLGREIEVEDKIIAKTIEIFKKRVLMFFKDCELSETSLNILFKIQVIIFLIDVHYENNWNYDIKQLKLLWSEINRLIIDLGANQNQTDQLLRDIRDYEEIEQKMRQRIMPDAYPIEYFYLKKSCDVRLQRQLVELTRFQRVSCSTGEQLDYDILGEILDDVDDLEEDMAIDVNNGNRLLFSLRRDKRATITEYRSYVRGIKEKHQSPLFDIGALADEILDKLDVLD